MQHLANARRIAGSGFLQRGLDVLMRPRDQLDLRLAEVGGDAGVREGRAEGRRVRRERQAAARLGAQAFFFNAAAHALELGWRQRFQAVLQCVHIVISPDS